MYGLSVPIPARAKIAGAVLLGVLIVLALLLVRWNQVSAGAQTDTPTVEQRLADIEAEHEAWATIVFDIRQQLFTARDELRDTANELRGEKATLSLDVQAL